jgi:hypothetical protein
MDITSPNRQQPACLGSPNKNPMYIGKVQRAVEGRVISLIKAWPSGGYGSFNLHSLHCLSMRNFYLGFNFIKNLTYFFFVIMWFKRTELTPINPLLKLQGQA